MSESVSFKCIETRRTEINREGICCNKILKDFVWNRERFYYSGQYKNQALGQSWQELSKIRAICKKGGDSGAIGS